MWKYLVHFVAVASVTMATAVRGYKYLKMRPQNHMIWRVSEGSGVDQLWMCFRGSTEQQLQLMVRKLLHLVDDDARSFWNRWRDTHKCGFVHPGLGLEPDRTRWIVRAGTRPDSGGPGRFRAAPWHRLKAEMEPVFKVYRQNPVLAGPIGPGGTLWIRSLLMMNEMFVNSAVLDSSWWKQSAVICFRGNMSAKQTGCSWWSTSRPINTWVWKTIRAKSESILSVRGFLFCTLLRKKSWI